MEQNKGNILMERYEVGRLLGQGNFAKVHYARNLKTGKCVAIKIIDKEKALKGGLTDTNIKQEIHVMRRLKHRNVLELYEVMASKVKIYFVIEYAKGGELFNKLAKGRLKEHAARNYFHQLINAVEFCHGKGVYHRDLKPENLLLDGDGVMKVSDFGLSALAKSKDGNLLRTTCGTPAYVAPEVLNGRGYDGAKADIWSCGVILYVMMAGYLPFHDGNTMVMYRKASNGDYKFPSWFAPELCRLVSRMIDPNPVTRISISGIKEDAWFNKWPDQISVEAINSSPEEEGKNMLCKPLWLNAFDIISLSAGLDLSGMFAERDVKNEESVKFVSLKSASDIMSKLEVIATSRKLNLKKRDRGLLILEEACGDEGRGRQSRPLSVDVFELTPFCHLVELRISGGSCSIEQWRIIEQNLREDLKDIVWSWIETQQHVHST